MNYNVTVLHILVYCINFLDRARFLMKQDGNKNIFVIFVVIKFIKINYLSNGKIYGVLTLVLINFSDKNFTNHDK